MLASAARRGGPLWRGALAATPLLSLQPQAPTSQSPSISRSATLIPSISSSLPPPGRQPWTTLDQSHLLSLRRHARLWTSSPSRLNSSSRGRKARDWGPTSGPADGVTGRLWSPASQNSATTSWALALRSVSAPARARLSWRSGISFSECSSSGESNSSSSSSGECSSSSSGANTSRQAGRPHPDLNARRPPYML